MPVATDGEWTYLAGAVFPELDALPIAVIVPWLSGQDGADRWCRHGRDIWLLQSLSRTAGKPLLKRRASIDTWLSWVWGPNSAIITGDKNSSRQSYRDQVSMSIIEVPSSSEYTSC